MPRTAVKKSSVKQDQSECLLSQLSPTALTLMADFFKVLSEASRLQIVCCLKSGEKNVTQIIEATGLGQANVSKHLKILAQAGVVTRSQQGINVFYQISNPFVFELCELVCDSISVQMQYQSEKLEQLKELQKSF